MTGVADSRSVSSRCPRVRLKTQLLLQSLLCPSGLCLLTPSPAIPAPSHNVSMGATSYFSWVGFYLGCPVRGPCPCVLGPGGPALGIHEWQRPAQVDPHSDQSQVSPWGFALATGRW